MSEAPTVFQRRIIIGAVLSVAAFALVGIRLAHVTLVQPLDSGREAAAITARADLTDRNGELLARDLPVKDLYARPQVFWDKVQAARDLASATGADEKRLLNGFNNAKHPYVLVARQISPAIEARVMHLGLPGLEFEPGSKRYYPDGRGAAQVVGRAWSWGWKSRSTRRPAARSPPPSICASSIFWRMRWRAPAKPSPRAPPAAS
jgi:cell division protein FtsI (penicillin-binding protein 3)